MPIASTKPNKLRMAVESALGTAGAYSDLRIEGMPEFRPNRTLIPNHVGGHANPYTVEKSEAVNLIQESAFSFDVRIRRPAANGGTPDMAKFFQSAGWNAAASTGATTLSGTPSVSSLIQTANVTAAGQYVLVEQSAGLHVPVLVSALDTLTITPHVRMAAAPATGAAVNPMWTFSPLPTTTAFKVPSDKTLSFIANLAGQWDDALLDLCMKMRACGLASIGDLTLQMGVEPKLSLTFHGVREDTMTPDDMVADSFNDSYHFAVVTPDLQFSMQAASAAGNIALVSAFVEEIKVNFGLKTVPIKGEGGTNVGGIVGYMLSPEPPTMDVTCQFQGLSTFDKKWFTELEGSNTSVCAQALQPTRDLDHPAFAVCLPNAHIRPGGEPKILTSGGEFIRASVGLEGSAAGIASGDQITEVGASPIFFGISTEPGA